MNNNKFATLCTASTGSEGQVKLDSGNFLIIMKSSINKINFSHTFQFMKVVCFSNVAIPGMFLVY